MEAEALGVSKARGRVSLLALLLVVQSIAAVFFVGDAFADIRAVGLDAHTLIETAVALSLVAGVFFGGLEMRRTLERMRRSEQALSAASGAFHDLIDSHFQRWRLTPAETEVAMLAIKGFDAAEIAAIRQVAGGTVRAQLANIYGKAGVTNRTQLLSVFIEDLLGGPIHAATGGSREAE